jgi:hypothetical protein
MIYVLLLVLAFVFMFDTKTNTSESGGSSNFYLSGGMSQKNYDKIESMEDKRKFMYLEEEFLELEKQAVANGVVLTKQATFLSNKIKETFPYLNFSYHGLHLKQIAEPTKVINTYLLGQVG